MFDNLIESKKKRQQSPTQAAMSIVFHIVLVVGAVKVTAGAAEAVTKKNADTVTFFEPPKPPPPPPNQPPPEAVVAANPPPQGFQTVIPPEAIPTTIPPVNLNQHFDARDFTGKGVEGGIATGVVGGTGPVTGQTYLEAQLDDPPVAIVNGTVRYPPALQSAGIQGSVTVQFVVDTSGHPEESSFKVLKSTHPAFEAPAREAVLKTVFRPGKLHGQPVRVLVQTAVNFKVGQ